MSNFKPNDVSDLFDNGKSEPSKIRELTPSEIEAKFVELMQDNPMVLTQYFVLIMGREAVNINAKTIDIDVEATFNEKRYKVSCRTKVKQIKNDTGRNNSLGKAKK